MANALSTVAALRRIGPTIAACRARRCGYSPPPRRGRCARLPEVPSGQRLPETTDP